MLSLVYGPVLLAAVPVVAAVGWSRVELKDHTWSQVSVGAVIGALVAGGVFAALR
jgi:membrane-associated phospholipid phosphatase